MLLPYRGSWWWQLCRDGSMKAGGCAAVPALFQLALHVGEAPAVSQERAVEVHQPAYVALAKVVVVVGLQDAAVEGGEDVGSAHLEQHPLAHTRHHLQCEAAAIEVA
jgi:hypothetical protein